MTTDPRYSPTRFPTLTAMEARIREDLKRHPIGCQRCKTADAVSVTRDVDTVPVIVCQSCEDATLAFVRRALFAIVQQEAP